jgi:hypothetical protein
MLAMQAKLPYYILAKVSGKSTQLFFAGATSPRLTRQHINVLGRTGSESDLGEA